MKRIRIRITLNDEALGTASGNPEIHTKFIASKAPDAARAEEEIASIGVEAVNENLTTVFSRTPDGRPHWWDYQVKGYLKDNTNALREVEGSTVWIDSHGVKPKKGSDTEAPKAAKRLTRYTYKRTWDKLVFVLPRELILNLPPGTTIGHCERSLRVDNGGIERVCLARSETVPAGTWFECEIVCLDDRLMPVVIELLDYGVWSGLGQWRNSGKGRFSWIELK